MSSLAVGGDDTRGRGGFVVSSCLATRLGATTKPIRVLESLRRQPMWL